MRFFALFESDFFECTLGSIGNSVGNIIARETELNNILCIDEIDLSEGDFIDVGEPLTNSVIYPVIIKSLIFA